MLQSANHVTNKPLGVHIGNLDLGIIGEHHASNCMHQMRFAQADTTIDKQWVVGFAWIQANLCGGRPRELITFTLDKILEHILGIQLAANYRCMYSL